jgi:hypothetical protein
MEVSMANMEGCPKLVLYENFDERDAFDITAKGWFDANIELPDGRHYTLAFYDLGRLKLHLGDSIENGEPCFAEQNLIVVPEVTIEAIQNSIRFLWEKDFFSYIKPE